MNDLLTKFPDPVGNLSPAVWADKQGVMHRAVGADVHRGIRLLWTACEKHDIPASAAWIQRYGDIVDCDGCATGEQS